MDEITKQKQFDRAVRRAIKKRSRKEMLIWMVVIFFISIILSLAVHFVPIWYDMLVRYHDPVYRPMDIERQHKALENDRRGGIKQY
ncbi:MAG: hypothetical protein KJ814_03790 [Proteobacteria bacterium]|nr:hypothetical protein [Pseudomonadota bacterium]